MAEKELPDGPSLEMPSLGSLFKRGRKKSAAPSGPAAGSGGDATDAASGSGRSNQAAAGDAPRGDDEAPSAEDFERLVRGTEPETAADSAPPPPTTSASASDESSPVMGESLVEETAARGIDSVTDRPADDATPVAEFDAPAEAEPDQQVTEVIPELPEHDLIAEAEEPALGDIEEDDPAPATERTAVVPVVADASVAATHAPEQGSPAPARRATTTPAAAAVASETDADTDDLDNDAVDDTGARRTLGDFQLPAVPAAAAAAITGAIVGLLAVGLTYFGLQGCEAVKGTSACGGPGIPILVVIMVLLVVVGSALLTAWKITDPTSTSFLAVGLLAVIALLFLIEVIFSPAMIIVIPLVSVGTYCLSQWVTARFIDEE